MHFEINSRINIFIGYLSKPMAFASPFFLIISKEIIKILAQNSNKLKLKDNEVLYGAIDAGKVIKIVKYEQK